MRWKLLFAFLLTFLLGGVAGVVVGVHAERQVLRQFDSPTPADFTATAVNRLEKELHLSADQSTAIRGILDTVAPDLVRIERTRRDGLMPLIEGLRPKISAVLDAEQQKKYHRLQDDLEKRLKLGKAP